MQSGKNVSTEGIRKVTFSVSKMLYKRVRGWTSGRASSYKTLLGTSPRLKPRRKERGCWVRPCKSYIGMCSSKWFLTLFGLKLGMCFPESAFEMAWEHSRHFVTQSLTFPRNDVSGKIAEIPYWWRVTTQIWVVFLIRWSKFPRGTTNQKHYPDLGCDTVWDFCARSLHEGKQVVDQLPICRHFGHWTSLLEKIDSVLLTHV